MALSGASRDDVLGQVGTPGLFMQVATAGVLFDTLTEIAADGTLHGELAVAWHSNADATRWEFDLRRNVAFHDGRFFSADDVQASFAPLQDGLLSDVESVEVAGSQRIIIHLRDGDPQFPMRLSHPQTVILPGGDAASAAAGVGTGLYRLHEFRPGRHLVAYRVADHYKDGRAGWFDSVELVSLPADEVRAEALRDHFVDAVDLEHPADLGDLENITLLPREDFMSTAVDQRLALPATVGSRWPMDNLRAAERWWMA